MRVSRVVGFAAGALAGGISAATAYGTVAKSSQIFGPSVFRGPGLRKSIALTFDDGPSESTPALLDYLEREEVKATFFQCGMNVKRLPHIAGQVAAAGHQIGNHTYSHPKLPFKTREFIDKEFTVAQNHSARNRHYADAAARALWLSLGGDARCANAPGIAGRHVDGDWFRLALAGRPYYRLRFAALFTWRNHLPA